MENLKERVNLYGSHIFIMVILSMVALVVMEDFKLVIQFTREDLLIRRLMDRVLWSKKTDEFLEFGKKID